MISKTKFMVEDITILKLFEKAGIYDVNQIKLLGAGEFNSVYLAKAENTEYIIKISPASNTFEYFWVSTERNVRELVFGFGSKCAESAK